MPRNAWRRLLRVLKESIEQLVSRYAGLAGEEKKEALARLHGFEDAERRIYDMIFGARQREALRALADLCRSEKSREAVAPLVRRDADRLTALPDAKARKTAYALIGLGAPDACADKLVDALKNERTQFARPSIILALGNTKEPQRYLKNYVIEPGDPKHMEAEREALKKALGKAAQPRKTGRLSLPESCLLTWVNRQALIEELRAAGLHFSDGSEADMIRASGDISRLRCRLDALYFTANAGDYAGAAKALDAFGCKGLSYRVETGALPAEQRRDAIREVSAGLAQHGYTDNPSAYAFELRLKESGMYAVFPDERFSYRKQTLSASIHPVTAASIIRLCMPYMKEGADVLDPFCGSGTLLIERAKAMNANSLVGVDISPYAIRAAVANRKASGIRFSLIQSDIRDFGAAAFDDVISNMPFGHRVSDHAGNVRLYAAFADKLRTLLKPGGYAFLFTQEKKLLRDTAGARKGFVLRGEEMFESGGLTPTLFIIQRSDP
jgi:2-polyprenyl-3-methyl-5-hydroxy-6-metoxy-1,4-benzoquinol methylase